MAARDRAFMKFL